MEHQRLYSTKKDVALTPAQGVAGTSDLFGPAMDMQGYEAIDCDLRFGTIDSGAALSVGWQWSDTGGNQSNEWTDVPTPDGGTASVSVPDSFDNGYCTIELTRPIHRYYRLKVDRGAQNSVIALATYHRWKPFRSPVDDGNTVKGIFVDHDNS